MKYSYDGIALSELIKNYIISDNKIIITYLDNSKYEVPYTKEFELNLLESMLRQAIERSKSTALYNSKEQKKNEILYALFQLEVTSLCYLNAYLTECNSLKIVLSLLGSITTLCTIMHTINYKLTNDEIKELEKYNIYLSLYNQINNSTELHSLNINTLDNYSLEELKEIRNNLNKNEKKKILIRRNSK